MRAAERELVDETIARLDEAIARQRPPLNGEGWRVWDGVNPDGSLNSPLWGTDWVWPILRHNLPYQPVTFDWSSRTATASRAGCRDRRCEEYSCGLYYYAEMLHARRLARRCASPVIARVRALSPVFVDRVSLPPSLANPQSLRGPGYRTHRLEILEVFVTSPVLIEAWPVDAVTPKLLHLAAR